MAFIQFVQKSNKKNILTIVYDPDYRNTKIIFNDQGIDGYPEDTKI